MPRILLSTFLALLFAANACAQAIETESNVVYGKGGDVDLQLDLARPKEGKGPFPAVVCIHGGGWKHGKRQDLKLPIAVLARNGYVAATISYRLSDQAVFPAQIEDCKAAVRWLRANARKYNVDPERIAVLGFSAGAHLACLIGTTDKKAGLEGKGGHPEQSSRVQAVVSFFGPTDLTADTWPKELKNSLIVPFMGGTLEQKRKLYEQASPVNHVSKDDPPFLFFHGSADKIVDVEQSKLLDKKLKAAGCSSRVVLYEGQGHGWTGLQLGDSIKQTLAFLDEKFKK